MGRLGRTLDVRSVSLRRNEALVPDVDVLLVLRGRYQRNNSWDVKARMAMLDTIIKGYQCAPVYIIEDKEREVEDVFDGAHRLETACDFVDNKWPITKCNSDTLTWELSPLAPFDGKYWKELPADIKQIFRSYEFVVNVIPPEIASDPEELATLWVRLNNSGNPLNDYEKYIPVYCMLYEFLNENAKPWFDTWVYPKTTSERGEVAVEMMRLLALSELICPEKFSSQVDMYKRWRRDKFGKTQEVEANLHNHKTELADRLRHLHLIYTRIRSGCDIKIKPNDVILMALIGRIARWTGNEQKLNRVDSDLMKYTQLMLGTPLAQHMKRLDAHSSNAPYQQRILYEIDRDVRDIVMTVANDPRLFTPTQKMEKLLEQGGVCPECSKRITPDQKVAGHHVIEFAKGGPTTMENLQVLHEECHVALHARTAVKDLKQ